MQVLLSESSCGFPDRCGRVTLSPAAVATQAPAWPTYPFQLQLPVNKIKETRHLVHETKMLELI